MPSLRSLSTLGVLTLASLSPAAYALHTPFEALPGETVAALRFDFSPAAMDDIVNQTEAGSLFFSADKIAQYKDFLERFLTEDEKGQEFGAILGELGLEPTDLFPMLASHLGAALVIEPVADREPLPTFLVWAEMEEEAADNALGALLRATEDSESMHRIDESVGGLDIYRISAPEDGYSFLLARLENRLFFAIGMSPGVPVEEDEEMEDPLSPDPIYEAAELNVLGTFLQSQKDGGSTFLSNFYQDPGVAAARPQHESRAEILLDLVNLYDQIPAEEFQEIRKIGVDGFTRFALWNGLQGKVDHTVAVIGAPAPRTGIARLLDLESFNFEAAEWVPASVSQYSVMAIDIPNLFTIATDVARQFMPPEQLEQQLGMADAQLNGMFGVDIQTLLQSFGNRFHYIKYPSTLKDVQLGDQSMKMPVASQGMVIDFDREDILQSIFGMVGAMAANPQSGMTTVDEQGFTGIRIAAPQGEAVIAFGLGKIVYGMGEGTASRIFSNLNTPPEGEEALRFAPEFRETQALVDNQPGVMFGYTDGDKAMGEIQTAVEFFESVLPPDESDDGFDLGQELMALVPSEEELKGLFGAIGNRAEVNDHGLLIEGLTEMK